MWTRRSFGLTAMAAGMTSGLATTTDVRAQEAIPPEQRLRNEGRYLPHYLALKARVEASDDEMARAELSQYAAFLGDEATRSAWSNARRIRALKPPIWKTPKPATPSTPSSKALRGPGW